MAFNSKTASEAGKKGGSVCKDPADVRNKQLTVTVTQAEYDAITAKAKDCGMSKAAFIVAATSEYESSLYKRMLRENTQHLRNKGDDSE